MSLIFLAAQPFTGTIVLAILIYTAISMGIAALIVTTRMLLIPGGEVTVTLNDGKSFCSAPGGKLLDVLGNEEVFVASACGGAGTCGLCKVRVMRGGGHILPTEQAHITRREAGEGWRLACQVAVKQDMEVEVDAAALETRKWLCRVRSNENVATFIKELVLELPPGETVEFKSGGYIQLEVPPHELSYRDFEVEDEYRDEWDRYDLWRYQSTVSESVSRAYSMANYPGEQGIIKLNVRVAPPPPEARPGTPPGQVSSYIFGLRPDDEVTISGPYGEFFIQETDAEMVYVGGGAGMAPLRSHIFQLLKGENSQRKISYWYGGRSARELFYLDEFEQLQRDHPNFSFHVVLSSPLPEDEWKGPTGFVHAYLYENYLKDHPGPEDIEYYMCGPPLMISAMRSMLDELGVEPEHVHFDDFGG
jgi:Na+-transporting NADH:ubiquinone oxidoreductase subunit F